jgi:outer membrane protein assembly factor BamB
MVGRCYAFDPDFEPGVGGNPGELKLVWKFDCLNEASYASGFKLERLKTAETIATPVFYKNRVYTSVGNDLHDIGRFAKPGRLICIDATQTGDITSTGRIWSFDDIRSTCCTVAIADGLLFTADASGVIYCLDAETGERYWTHRTATVWASPLVADGKAYFFTNGHGVLVFAAQKEKKLLSENLPDGQIVASPAVAHGVLFFATYDRLYALEEGKSGGLAPWNKDMMPAAPATKVKVK